MTNHGISEHGTTDHAKPASRIASPDDAALAELCQKLAELARPLDESGDWPATQLQLCGEYGVYEWFIEECWGGRAWNDVDVVRGYLQLSAACLTTTFIITQRTGACRRIASAANQNLKERLLPDLAAGNLFATVGISHLTTSRRHLARPVLRAQRAPGGFVLEGFSPWVTGAPHADYVVVGATLMLEEEPTEEQLLIALPTDLPGVVTPPPGALVGVTGSHTGEVRLERVFVEDEWVMAGPIENVMSQGVGARTGGYETSTLALGVARASLDLLGQEASHRHDLARATDVLREEFERVRQSLIGIVRGDTSCTHEQLRQQANSLALRSAQAYLAAAKGTGYVVGHPAGRLCREALFFLVWSCPQPVVSANLCELAGIID